ncbi:hypothetical protein SAMN04490220_1587 [Rhodococcus jostii]|uniref:Uncharacterized protein n=1 Tax=Rhodococcus jostii TaxID=132919 RepID=A0A1H4SC43_RHOJO|nr:hypothetical protein SAMN04490220_1587 [Rhodococcus jostii]
MPRSIAGRHEAFEQLGQLGNGDLDRAEQRITIHSGVGHSPAETFNEVGVQLIGHDISVSAKPRTKRPIHVARGVSRTRRSAGGSSLNTQKPT